MRSRIRGVCLGLAVTVETFVVRIWTAEDPSERSPAGHRPLHGLVEHVGDGRRSTFRGGDELLGAIRAGLEAEAGEGRLPKEDQ